MIPVVCFQKGFLYGKSGKYWETRAGHACFWKRVPGFAGPLHPPWTIRPSKKRRPTLPKVSAIKELSRKGTYTRHGIKVSFRRKDVSNITPNLCKYRYVGNIQKTSRQLWNIKTMPKTKTAIKNNLTNEFISSLGCTVTIQHCVAF